MQIGFPNLNLMFYINPIAISIFNINIYWYGIIFAIAYIISLIICKKNEGLYDIKFDDVIKTSFFVIIFGIIGARIYYVIFNYSKYINNFNEILQIQNGGLAIYGGIIFGIITIYVLSNIYKYNYVDMLDFLVLPLLLFQAIGRLGNYINGEAYGYATNVFWKMRIYYGIEYMDVHPTFLYEIIATLFLFILIYLYRKKRKYKGQMVAIYFVYYGSIRWYIERLRQDSLMIGKYRISQIVSVVIICIGIIILVKNRRKKSNKIEEKQKMTIKK